MASRTIVLFKQPSEEKGDDTFTTEAAKYGDHIVFAPVLDIELCDIPALATTLATKDTFDAVIFTSAKAVEAAEAAMKIANLEAWTFPTWVVGVACKTAAAAKLGATDIHGEDSGTGAKLAEAIISGNPTHRYLFLCGDKVMAALPDALRRAGVSFTQQVVYHSRQRAAVALPAECPAPNWVVFFSPSGVSAVAAAYSTGLPTGTKIATIGPSTAREVHDKHWSVAAVASSPTAVALWAAMNEEDAHARKTAERAKATAAAVQAEAAAAAAAAADVTPA